MTASLPVLLVEGNISAGKSTLCKALATELGYALFLEPTTTNPFLVKYYAEPAVYGLPLQLWLLKQRFVTYCKALQLVLDGRAKGVIMDRSLFSDIVFAVKNHEDKNITRHGYEYYLALREKLLFCVPLPTAVLYLDASPAVCHERIHNMRKRECEDGIPLAYLEGLDRAYTSCLHSLAEQGVKIIRRDWNHFGDIREVAAETIAHMSEASSTATLSTCTSGLAKLANFVADSGSITAAMFLADAPPDASAGDVHVPDPSPENQEETVIMPQHPEFQCKTSPMPAPATAQSATPDTFIPSSNSESAKLMGGATYSSMTEDVNASESPTSFSGIESNFVRKSAVVAQAIGSANLSPEHSSTMMEF